MFCSVRDAVSVDPSCLFNACLYMRNPLFIPIGVKKIFSLNFQNFHIWAWNPEFEIWRKSQSCICTCTLSQRRQKLSLFSLYEQSFSRYGQFSYFQIWVWNLEYEERFHRCICTLFLPDEVKNKLIFCSTGSTFRDTSWFKNFYIWHEIWNLKKGSKVAYVHSFYPQGRRN